jgi:hypothetical protein
MAMELEQWMQRRGHNPTARDVGRLLTEAFVADREELQRVIETQLRKLREMPDTSPSAPGVPMSYAPVDLSRMQLASSSITPAPGQTGSGFTKSAFTGPAQPQVAAVTATGAAPQKPFPVGIVLGGLALLVVLSGGLLAFAILHKDSPVTAKPIASAPIATPTTGDTTIPASDRITLSLGADRHREVHRRRNASMGIRIQARTRTASRPSSGRSVRLRSIVSRSSRGDVQKAGDAKRTRWSAARLGQRHLRRPRRDVDSTSPQTRADLAPR